jgi:hypothetical protein
MARDKAEQVVDAILSDLSGRAGIGNELDAIDDDIKAEMKQELIEIAREILGG